MDLMRVSRCCLCGPMTYLTNVTFFYGDPDFSSLFLVYFVLKRSIRRYKIRSQNVLWGHEERFFDLDITYVSRLENTSNRIFFSYHSTMTWW